jgi:hypothetical protein
MQTSATPAAYSGDEFDHLVLHIQNHFSNRVDESERAAVAFTTSVDGDALFEIYLNAFEDLVQRQIHNCNCCRHYFRHYGNLVFIDAVGDLEPAVWPRSADGIYAAPMAAVYDAVKAARVTGVFIFNEKEWRNTNGSSPIWKHFRVVPTYIAPHRDLLTTPFQAMAAKKEDFNNVTRFLTEVTADQVAIAAKLLAAESLYRSDKLLGQVVWLQKLYESRTAVAKYGSNGRRVQNATWKAVAAAPAGFCHPRSGMVGTLLEDIAAGKSFEEVKRAFDAKMHPAHYQRPQAAPAAQNVRQAEEIVAKLGIAPSLQRREARYSEMQTFWDRNIASAIHDKSYGKLGTPVEGTVFGHLKTKGDEPAVTTMSVPVQTITWEKFKRTVLPDALRIQLSVKADAGPYFCATAAVNAEAPPILQWDSEEVRNPYAWYLYVSGKGRFPQQWGMNPGYLVDVKGIGYQPSMWQDEEKFKHQGTSVFFYLDGARDGGDASGCLFPEILRSELHQVRATIEAYSQAAKLERVESDQVAAGIRLSSGQPFGHSFVVTTKTGNIEYKIDRWD